MQESLQEWRLVGPRPRNLAYGVGGRATVRNMHPRQHAHRLKRCAVSPSNPHPLHPRSPPLPPHSITHKSRIKAAAAHTTTLAQMMGPGTCQTTMTRVGALPRTAGGGETCALTLWVRLRCTVKAVVHRLTTLRKNFGTTSLMGECGRGAREPAGVQVRPKVGWGIWRVRILAAWVLRQKLCAPLQSGCQDGILMHLLGSSRVQLCAHDVLQPLEAMPPRRHLEQSMSYSVFKPALFPLRHVRTVSRGKGLAKSGVPGG
jgi:hypothetical protein